MQDADDGLFALFEGGDAVLELIRVSHVDRTWRFRVSSAWTRRQ
jgi:hypothetical protein